MSVRTIGSLALAIALAFAAWCAGSAAKAEDFFTLSSSAFKEGGTIALKHGGSDQKLSPNCIGQNISPQFSWSNPPAGTKSFAFILVDPEGFGGAGLVHFVFYGIPAAVTGFAEGELTDKPSDKYIAGTSPLGGHYVGPCAGRGTPHHYTFTLIATDLEPTALKPGLSLDEFKAALKGHSKGVTGLVGLYARQ